MTQGNYFQTPETIRQLKIELAKAKNEIGCAQRDLKTVSGRVASLQMMLDYWEKQEKKS